jgi:hypothetical protein
MTFKIDQQTDCDIKTAEELCSQVFEANGYLVEIESNRVSFLRKNKKNYDRFMPIIELLRGFGEGRMIFSKHDDFLKVKILHRWIMHVFTSTMLIGILSLIFYLYSRQDFNILQPVIAFGIVCPISIIGYFGAKSELQELFDKLFTIIKRDYKVIQE